MRNIRLGLGTWGMGEDPQKAHQEIAAVRFSLTQGVRLIDMAEMYGDGGAESLVGEAIRGFARKSLVLVSKVCPQNARDYASLRNACEASLARLKTDYLDYYLLHWREDTPLYETVQAFEHLKRDGLIHHWGVSNFTISDMKELWQIPGGRNCTINQVLYHLGSRGIEVDLLPWMKEQGVELMAYSPLANNVHIREHLITSEAVISIAQKHHVSVYQVLLAFVLRDPETIVIPKSSNSTHLLDDLAALRLKLDAADLALLDATFPPPDHPVPLEIY